MTIIKPDLRKSIETASLILIYIMLIVNLLIFKDSTIAIISAFFGISYTFFAGKGYPFCYLFGVTGSVFYCMLALHNHLWGNLALYAGYYIPMQILGFFSWNKNLKQGKNEIIKTSMSSKQKIKIFTLTLIMSALLVFILQIANDKNPVIDGITTVFSITGMYLTVKRAIEQWSVWILVNGLSAFMWGMIALSGERVYSTVLMWCVYVCLAIYFHICWKKEIT